MKGLLLKDFYMTRKYCSKYLVIGVIFCFFSLKVDFAAFYPCLMAGIIPTSLLSYDEFHSWERYSCSLPYTRAQIVSSKFIVGMVFQLIMFVLVCLIHAILTLLNGNFVAEEYIFFTATVFCVMGVFSVINPLTFKYGTIKGRALYYVCLAVLSVVGVFLFTMLGRGRSLFSLDFPMVVPLIFIASALVYALSWYLSVVFYKKREF